MILPVRCPDCDDEKKHADLQSVIAVPDSLMKNEKLTAKQLVAIGDGLVGYCPTCEKMWEVKVTMDEVFAGPHKGDPK